MKTDSVKLRQFIENRVTHVEDSKSIGWKSRGISFHKTDSKMYC